MKYTKVKIKEICRIVSGTTPKTNKEEFWNGNISWITPAEIKDNSFYIYSTERTITQEGKDKNNLFLMPKGTVLLSSRAPIGKVAIAGIDMCCNQGFKNLICSNRINNEFLYYFFKSKTEFLNSLGRGATFKELTKSIVENINISLPSLQEQFFIKEKLKKIDSLINLKYIFLQKLNELVNSRFNEMFGDHLLSSNKKEFITIPEVSINLDYRRIPIKQTERSKGQYPYYGASGIVDFVNGYIFDEALLLVSEDGANLIARSTPIAFSIYGKTWVNNHAHVLKFNSDEERIYVEFLLNMMDIKQYISGTAQPKLTQENLNKISFYWPEKDKLKSFFDLKSEVDKSKFLAY